MPSDEREGKRLKEGTDGWIDDEGMVCGEDIGKRYSTPITRSIGNAQLKRAGIVTCRAEVPSSPSWPFPSAKALSRVAYPWVRAVDRVQLQVRD